MGTCTQPRRSTAGARALAGVVAALAGCVAVQTAPPALAHDADPHGSGAEAAAHARTDLVGETMGDIVEETRDRARELGTAALERRTAQRLARAPAAASDDPHEVGAWSEVVDTPVVPVFSALLPDGDVLMWDSMGDGGGTEEGAHAFTRAMVWDPRTDTAERVDVPGYNIFCAGYTQLPDGDVLVVGGNKNSDLEGIRQTHVFDWQTHTWSRGPDMDAERWYPSVAALADGTAVIVAGGTAHAEVYDPAASTPEQVLRTLTGFLSFGERVYPFLVPRTDGRVSTVGPGPTQTMSTAGRGSAVDGPDDGVFREYGAFATYLPDRTLVTGGGTGSGPGHRAPPLATARVVDTSGRGVAVHRAASMHVPRRLHGLTVLPDGTVLATGGLSTNPEATEGLVDLRHPVLAAERWDPATDAWTVLAPASRIREYHSTATLLPDGRVLTGGGGVCGACLEAGYLEKNVEYYSPPYLFNPDGSPVTADQRPQVTAPGAVATGDRLRLTSPDAAGIERLALVKLGAPTHSVDQGQRYVPLTFTRSGDTLTARAPATTGVAPPGYYLLFAVDRDGVPSIASTIQVTPGAQPGPPTPVTHPTGDLARDRPALASGSLRGTRPRDATDASTRTRWAAPRRPGTAWLRVGLGRSVPLDRVVVLWGGARRAAYRIQTSLDGRRFTTVATVARGAVTTTTSRFGLRRGAFVRVVGPSPYAVRALRVHGRR